MTAITRPPAASSELRACLRPAGDALLHDAEARARAIVDEAARTAASLVADAERDAQAAVDHAVHRHAQVLEARAQQDLDRVRSEAHASVLATRAELRRLLIREVHAAAAAMRDDPRYPALLDHLDVVARARLGPDAVVERDPDPEGGLRAHAGARRLDYTLGALADRALDALADEVVTLWT